MKAKIKKKRADAGKEEFFNFTKDQLSELNIGDIQIQTFGSDDIILIRIENSTNEISTSSSGT